MIIIAVVAYLRFKIGIKQIYFYKKSKNDLLLYYNLIIIQSLIVIKIIIK